MGFSSKAKKNIKKLIVDSEQLLNMISLGIELSGMWFLVVQPHNSRGNNFVDKRPANIQEQHL